LGVPYGQAVGRLRKMIMFQLAQEAGRDTCVRCGQKIESIDDFSIDHKIAWESAPDSNVTYFDLGNIAFAHLGCNIGAEQRAHNHCKHGHEYTPENTFEDTKWRRRLCRQCRRDRARRQYHKTRTS